MAVLAMTPKNAVESLRDIVQDLLVPELKAIKVELESQRRENHLQFENVHNQFENVQNEFRFVRSEAKTTAEALRSDTEALRSELRIRDERQTGAIQAISDKLSTLMEVRERLAVLEGRTKRA